jgi:hypothetical protein
MKKIDRLEIKFDKVALELVKNGINYEIKSFLNNPETISGFYSSTYKNDEFRRLKDASSVTAANHHETLNESVYIDLICEYFSVLKEIRVEKNLFKEIF